GESDLAVDQNLQRSLEVLPGVHPVAGPGPVARHEQADGIPVPQGAGADAENLGCLADLVVGHDYSLRHDAASRSRAGTKRQEKTLKGGVHFRVSSTNG